MSQEIETGYDKYLAELGNKLGKIDVELAMRLLYLERKFPEVDPQLDIIINFKKGTDVERKEFQISLKFGLAASSRSQHVHATGRGNMGILVQLSSDSDIEEITGTATAASY